MIFGYYFFFYFDLNQNNHLQGHKISLILLLLGLLCDMLQYHHQLVVQLNFETGEIGVFLLSRSFLTVFLVITKFEFFLPLGKIPVLRPKLRINYVLKNSLMYHQNKNYGSASSSKKLEFSKENCSNSCAHSSNLGNKFSHLTISFRILNEVIKHINQRNSIDRSNITIIIFIKKFALPVSKMRVDKKII